MKISIVTISYNQAKFLEQTILSVLNQEHSDIEYILVDPGSTDGSREIIQKYADRIDHIILDPDRGPADGLNKGFAQAHGDIYCFLNSDDVLEPGALAQVAQYFETHPKVDVVSGHSWIINADGNVMRRFFSDRVSLKRFAYRASILSQASTFFRAESFQRTDEFNIKNRSNWDDELFIDMALTGAQFSLTSKFWSRFRIHEEGITGSGKLNALHESHGDRMFMKIMGRKPSSRDRLLAFAARFARKVLNPSDTIERLKHGPISRAAPTKK